MKENEAPEKIYIPRLEGNETFVHEWSAIKFRKYFSREIAENVEYTRTDAFIDKACEWLSKHAIKYYLDGRKFLGTDELVEDFKKAMKV